MKRRVKVGEEFDAEIRFVEASEKAGKERIRGLLALIIVVLVAAFLIGAAVYGVVEGEFSKLNSVWSVSGAIVGCVTGYYFRGSDNND